MQIISHDLPLYDVFLWRVARHVFFGGGAIFDLAVLRSLLLVCCTQILLSRHYVSRQNWFPVFTISRLLDRMLLSSVYCFLSDVTVLNNIIPNYSTDIKRQRKILLLIIITHRTFNGKLTFTVYLFIKSIFLLLLSPHIRWVEWILLFLRGRLSIHL